MRPLEGIRVLDFSTLLPGPLASLLLAEAGAEVVKIERPGRGDEMRSYTPKFGEDSVNFALLNRGKRSLAIDLRASGSIEKLTPLIAEADIVLEQFRPGVMQRLGLGYDAVSHINPRIIYVSITGFGQSGPYASIAAHDLNFCAQVGILSLTKGSDGAPVLPAGLFGDIAGGAYPAVLNILLALRQRDQTGKGCMLDIGMADNLFTIMYWAIGNGQAAGQWPRQGGELVTGGSPRYQLYRTADDKFVAAAPLEDKFWENFCELIGVDPAKRDDLADPEGAILAAAECIRGRTSEAWRVLFEGQDVCCNIVATLQEGLADPHFRARGLFDRKVTAGGAELTALPVPIDAQFRGSVEGKGYPALGEDNAALFGKRD